MPQKPKTLVPSQRVRNAVIVCLSKIQFSSSSSIISNSKLYGPSWSMRPLPPSVSSRRRHQDPWRVCEEDQQASSQNVLKARATEVSVVTPDSTNTKYCSLFGSPESAFSGNYSSWYYSRISSLNC